MPFDDDDAPYDGPVRRRAPPLHDGDSADESGVLSVSALTGLIKRRLEGDFPSVTVEGEISNWRPASSGHLYFSLKDKDAVIQAVMFRGRAMGLRFEPRDGVLVRATGAISVYPPRGNYQIVCERMEKAGAGDLLQRLEELKRRLAAEGLFDEARKRSLPRLPSRVVVITSPTGAAVRDVINVLRRRAPGISVTILPALVQGAEAASDLVAMLTLANREKLGDVIILGRGGGSLEDLLPFSDEALVRAVASSEIPVISAVGHEIDWSLSDFAADLRAPTPSAAAELVSEDRQAMAKAVREIGRNIARETARKLEGARTLVSQFTAENLEYTFRNMYQPFLMRFDDAKEGLFSALQDSLVHSRRRLEIAWAGMEPCDPAAVLNRGYAIVRKEGSAQALRKPEEAAAGDRIGIQLAGGTVAAVIEEGEST